VGGKPAARKIAATPYKNNRGDDRHFVSAFKQGFGPAFFFSPVRSTMGPASHVTPFSPLDSKLQL
jgi:hypothetical protein